MASWFNPTDFATGVLESLDKRIDRNAEEARVYKEEQCELAKQSKQAIDALAHDELNIEADGTLEFESKMWLI